jgi:hypothetical protein
MRNKLTILGFVVAMVVWFAVAVGTLLELDEVADNAVALRAQTTLAPASSASAEADSRIVAAQADTRASASRIW